MIKLKNLSTGELFSSFYPNGFNISRERNWWVNKNPERVEFDLEGRLLRVDIKYSPPKVQKHQEFGSLAINNTWWETSTNRYDGYVKYNESGKAEEERRLLLNHYTGKAYTEERQNSPVYIKTTRTLADVREEIEAGLKFVRKLRDDFSTNKLEIVLDPLFETGDPEFPSLSKCTNPEKRTVTRRVVNGFITKLSDIAELTFDDIMKQVARFNEIYSSIPIIPPGQGNAAYLQIVIGCPKSPHNPCSYCNFYRDRTFSYKDFDAAKQHIEDVIDFFGSAWKPNYGIKRKIFIGDGNGLVLPSNYFLQLLDYTNQRFNFGNRGYGHKVEGIAFFADVKTANRKSPKFFKELKARHVKDIYLGIESGCKDVLNLVNKGCTPEEVVCAISNIKEGGIKVNGIIMIGLGEREFATRHLRDTESLLRKVQPDVVMLSDRVIFPGTEYAKQINEGKLTMLTDKELLEQKGVLDLSFLQPQEDRIYPYNFV